MYKTGNMFVHLVLHKAQHVGYCRLCTIPHNPTTLLTGHLVL